MEKINNLEKFGQFIDDLREKLELINPNFTISFESDTPYGDTLSLSYPELSENRSFKLDNRIGELKRGTKLYNENLELMLNNIKTFFHYLEQDKKEDYIPKTETPTDTNTPYDFSKFKVNIENVFKNMGYENLRLIDKPIFGWNGKNVIDPDEYNTDDDTVKTYSCQTFNKNLTDVLKENKDKVVILYVPSHVSMDFIFRGVVVEKPRFFNNIEIKPNWNPLIEIKLVDGDKTDVSSVSLNDVISMQEYHNVSMLDEVLEILIEQKENG